MGVEREHLAGTERSKSMEGRESTNDAVHLLRIRTRRGEAVVVPGKCPSRPRRDRRKWLILGNRLKVSASCYP